MAMQIQSGADKVARVCDLVKHGLSVLGVIVSLGLVMWGVKEISRAAPGAITALAGLLRDWRIGEIVLALGNVFFYGLYRLERSGKKRAIARKGAYQKRAEAGDPQRTTSGLTENGNTPKPERIRRTV